MHTRFGFLCTVLVAVGLLLSGCGKDAGSRAEPQAGPAPSACENPTLSLLVFSAPWCENCKRDVPAMDALVKGESAALQQQVCGRLLVTSAETPSKAPTQEIADKYKALLGVSFVTEVDPWRWQTFQKYFGKKFQLPAAVVLDSSGNVVRAFAPGSFNPTETMAVIRENVK